MAFPTSVPAVLLADDGRGQRDGHLHLGLSAGCQDDSGIFYRPLHFVLLWRHQLRGTNRNHSKRFGTKSWRSCLDSGWVHTCVCVCVPWAAWAGAPRCRTAGSWWVSLSTAAPGWHSCLHGGAAPWPAPPPSSRPSAPCTPQFTHTQERGWNTSLEEQDLLCTILWSTVQTCWSMFFF